MTNNLNPFNPGSSPEFSSPFQTQTLKTSKEVDLYHTNDDVDSSSNAHHHTLGLGPNQAANGRVVAQLMERVEELEARVSDLEGP